MGVGSSGSWVPEYIQIVQIINLSKHGTFSVVSSKILYSLKKKTGKYYWSISIRKGRE